MSDQSYQDNRLHDFFSLVKSNTFARGIFTHINLALKIGNKHKEPWKLFSEIYAKTKMDAIEFMEFNSAQPSVIRNPNTDRVFPIDTVEIISFNTKHRAKAEMALIHTGAFADEYARSMNALAVTIANDIFFRNGAFKPETEEGRKVLAHELTHIAQWDEDRASNKEDHPILEAEAERAEDAESWVPDPLITVSVNGRQYTFPRSRMDSIGDVVSDTVAHSLKRHLSTLSESERLETLTSFHEMFSGSQKIWLK